jgi:hypothetical protein
MRKAIAISAFVGAILAIVLVIFRGWESGYSPKSVGFLAIAGILLGAIAAPEIEPRAFRYPALWQVLFAVIGCALVAFVWDAPAEGYLLAIVGGGVLGYAAPMWIKHINP